MGREEEMRRKTLNEEKDGEKQRVRRERGTHKEEEDVRGGKGKREKQKTAYTHKGRDELRPVVRDAKDGAVYVYLLQQLGPGEHQLQR